MFESPETQSQPPLPESSATTEGSLRLITKCLLFPCGFESRLLKSARCAVIETKYDCNELVLPQTRYCAHHAEPSRMTTKVKHLLGFVFVGHTAAFITTCHSLLAFVTMPSMQRGKYETLLYPSVSAAFIPCTQRLRVGEGGGGDCLFYL